MDERDRQKLLTEYLNKIKFVYMPIVKLGAYSRFDIVNGKIVSITKWAQFYALFLIVLVDIFTYLLLLETVIKNKYLILPEYISVIEFTVLHNLSLINVNIINQHSGAELANKLLDVDVFFGIGKTKFMRNVTDKETLIWSMLFASFQLFLGILLSLTFRLPIYVYIVGGAYFLLLMCMCYDNIFLVVFFKFLCLRIHYLNVSLVKMAHLDTEYLLRHLLLYPFLWKKKYDDYVDLQNADPKFYSQAFKMIFELLQRISRCFRFLIFACSASLVFGTFLAVQSIIIFIKDPEVPVIRTMALSGWCVTSWMLLLGITGQSDRISQQIQRTKLICTYIQLNPNHPDELFDLTENILEVLSVSDGRMSIYGLYYFEGSLIRSIATSVFIYITMQLQIAFPKTTNIEAEDTFESTNESYYRI